MPPPRRNSNPQSQQASRQQTHALDSADLSTSVVYNVEKGVLSLMGTYKDFSRGTRVVYVQAQ